MKKLKTIRRDIQLRKEKYKKYPCSSAIYLEIVDNYILTAPISATEVVIPIRYDEQLGFILDGFLISFNVTSSCLFSCCAVPPASLLISPAAATAWNPSRRTPSAT